MIQNIVFDFGQVLVHFDPDAITREFLEKEEEIALVREALFDRRYWDRLDEGSITDEEVLAAVRARLPAGLGDAAERTYWGWIDHLPPIEGMWELLRRLRREGYPVYILSNISRYFAAHADRVPILSEADGCIFSAVCGYSKPHEEIFSYLCRRFSLRPEQTLFIDDNQQNIDAARAFGLQVYLFDGDAARLRAFLKGALPLPPSF